MHDAFISYARRDSREFVERLGDALEAIGKDVWVDLEDIPPASQWERDLRDGVAASGSFVFVISPRSVSSEHCRRELDCARDGNKRIIPVVHREVADAEAPAAVASLNWIPQQGSFEDDFDGSVRKLVQAIETDLDAVRAHTRWQERAQEWRDGDRARGLLATGAELRDADQWLEAQTGRVPEPTAVQAEWIAAGRRQAARRQRLLFGAAVAALLISAALGVLALIQRNQAVEQRDTARSNELATDSIANLESDPELSLILALEAVRTKTSDRTVQTLRRAILSSHVRARFDSPAASPIDASALSPDGKLVASAIENGTAVLWDSQSGETLATLQTPASFVSDVAFAPDGRTVITADSDGIVRTWSVPDGRELSSFRAADAILVSAAISPDGDSIAVSGVAGNAAVFSLSSGDETPLATRGRINSIEFSPRRR